MYECVMGLRKHEGQGCILADEMYAMEFIVSKIPAHIPPAVRGLGKTLQVSLPSHVLQLEMNHFDRLSVSFGPYLVRLAGSRYTAAHDLLCRTKPIRRGRTYH